jgi:hypothetical protein
MNAKHTPYFNLLDALKENGCPICFLVNKTTHKFMDDFLYESVNDPGVREDIKASMGFCNRHAWQLQKFGDGFGQAIVYNDLIKTVLEKLKEIDTDVSIKDLLKKLDSTKPPKKICMFCKGEKDVEERYISVFWESFDDPEFSFQYKSSFGLCLSHISSVLKKCKSAQPGKDLFAIETEKLSGLIEELKEFMRKHDYRFSKEKFGKEGDSWIRAIEKFIGKEGIYQKGA